VVTGRPPRSPRRHDPGGRLLASRDGHQYRDDTITRKRSVRSYIALEALAKFVEALPDDDPDLSTFRQSAPSPRLP
jgi:hypothetical protein